MKKYVSPLAEITTFDVEELIMSGNSTPEKLGDFDLYDTESKDEGWGEIIW